MFHSFSCRNMHVTFIMRTLDSNFDLLMYKTKQFFSWPSEILLQAKLGATHTPAVTFSELT